MRFFIFLSLLLCSASVTAFAQDATVSRFEPLNDQTTDTKSRPADEQNFAEGLRARCGFGFLRVVPDLTGLSPEQARAQIKKCNLAYLDGEPNRVFSYEAIGTVGSQEPRGGRIVRKGTEIAPLLSAGLAAPDVLGLTEGEAEQFLKNLQISATMISQRDEAAPGTVVAQTPSAGELFEFGLPFSLVISEGPWIEVPALKNVQYQPAMNRLDGLALHAVHGGGSLDSGSRQNTICEKTVWYPVVERTEPKEGTRLFAKDTVAGPVKVFTRKQTDFVFHQPPGRLCP